MQLSRERERMDLETWLPMYRGICEEFGFSEAEDRKSAVLLSGMLISRGLLGQGDSPARVPGRVVVCGDSEHLEQELDEVRRADHVVAADGATTVLVENDIRPDIIVTDLDGTVRHQIEANESGTLVFVHAHGDNTGALKKYVRRFEGPLFGTCQCAPVEGLLNFGGFTDGDRAVCICQELGATSVRLMGFDFEVPREKLGKSSQSKMRKLVWARRILERLCESGLEIEGL